VPIIAAVYAGERLEGVLRGKVRRDGANATSVLAAMCEGSRFRPQLRLVLLQGIALAGFNVVDVQTLSELTGLPVLVVVRKAPNMVRIRSVLERRVPGGARKWQLIEKAGPMERVGAVWIQRVGLSATDVSNVLRDHCRHGHIPDPLRTAHIVASAFLRGESHGRV
jgi:uncharacterized protein